LCDETPGGEEQRTGFPDRSRERQARPEVRRRYEARARIGEPAHRPAEKVDEFCAQPAREAGAWQIETGADSGRPDGMEKGTCFRSEIEDAYGELPEPGEQGVAMADPCRHAGTGKELGGERSGRAGD